MNGQEKELVHLKIDQSRQTTEAENREKYSEEEYRGSSGSDSVGGTPLRQRERRELCRRLVADVTHLLPAVACVSRTLAG